MSPRARHNYFQQMQKITASALNGSPLYLIALWILLPLTASAGSQTITFDPIPNQILGVSPFPIAAEASSGLPVTFASATPTVCRNSGDLVMLLKAGTCSITASQGGNASFSATSATRSFTVSQAKPSAGFAAVPGSLLTGADISSIAAGDFNGDGVPDLAVSFPNAVDVFLGNGAGGFALEVAGGFAVGNVPNSVVVGDFNGDGIQDLATANAASSNVTVLLGNGTGGFTPAVGSPFPAGSQPEALAVGDFNGDGIEDLAVPDFTSHDQTGMVLLGSGSGAFKGTPFALGDATSVVVGDFNGDTIQDLALTYTFQFGGGPNVVVLLGNGSGGFTSSPGSPFTAGTGAVAVALGDFNGDGVQDLAVANYYGNNVTVFLGNGTGGFAAAAGSPFAVGNAPMALVAGDFNGDGIQDLATANVSSNNITVLLGNGKGVFTAAPGSPFTLGAALGSLAYQAASLAVGDFNGDGIEDLAVTISNDAVTNGVIQPVSSDNVTVLLGVSNLMAQTISFGPLTNVTLGAPPFNISATASSGLPVIFSSTTPSVCTVAGSTVTIVGGGTCSILAKQAGNETYAVAAVSQSFNVSITLPTITTGGIVPIYSSSTAIEPGEWASIYGTGLANGTTVWGGDYPTSLGGTSVTINGKLAYLSVVSPTQINFQAPTDPTTGSVPVLVKTVSGTVTSTVTLAQFAPSFFLLDAKHIAGIILRLDGSGAYGGGSYDIIGPTGTSLGYQTVAAKAGDSVALFCTGLGPTSPTVTAGQAFSGSAATTNAVTLSVGGTKVTPGFAGLSGAGVYQINLTVPSGLGGGDVSLHASVGGAQTPSGVVISLQ